jgi:hypothetical protein
LLPFFWPSCAPLLAPPTPSQARSSPCACSPSKSCSRPLFATRCGHRTWTVWVVPGGPPPSQPRYLRVRLTSPSISGMRSSRWISASTSPLLVLPTTCCWYVRLTLHRSYTASRRLYSSKQVDVAFENECCKHIFQLFQMFQMYVASVSYGCCKSRSECIICCNECTHILQALFQMFNMLFETYVASVFI